MPPKKKGIGRGRGRGRGFDPVGAQADPMPPPGQTNPGLEPPNLTKTKDFAPQMTPYQQDLPPQSAQGQPYHQEFPQASFRGPPPSMNRPPPGFKGPQPPRMGPPTAVTQSPPMSLPPPGFRGGDHQVAKVQQELSSFQISRKSPPLLRSSFPPQQVGTLGRKISLQANFFSVDIPQGSLFHYDVEIQAMKNGQAVKNKITKGRNFNEILSRQVMDQLINTFDLFHQILPAFDGNKNLITRRQLPIDEPTKCKVSIVENGKNRDFMVIVKPVQKDFYNCEISLEPLHEAMAGRSLVIPQECIMALDLVLRHGPSLRYVPVGRSFFQKPSRPNEVPLGGGREVWFGFAQSLRPGWKPLNNSTRYYLNIDKSATAFFTVKPLLEHIQYDILKLRQLPPIFSDTQRRIMEKALKGIKVQVTHLPYPRKYTIAGISRKTASKITFEMDGKEIAVDTYFKSAYNKQLQYPSYPCVEAGTTRVINLPLEVCQIAENQPSRGKLTPEQQAAMIKPTAVPPEKRFREIRQSVGKVIDSNRAIMKEFEIKIDTEPIQFQGRVLPTPLVQYQQQTMAQVKNGQWEMTGKKFVVGKEVRNWVLMALCSTNTESDLDYFGKLLVDTARKSGMNMSPPLEKAFIEEVDEHNKGLLEKLMRALLNQYPQLELVVVVLPAKSKLYNPLKKLAETDLGIITQCLTDDNLYKCMDQRFSFRYLLNLLQKINAKLGGTNTSLFAQDKPSIFRRPIMIVGADVTHPAPDDKENYSIAAAVGSMDGGPSRYTSTVQLQKNDKEIKAKEETILNLTVMMKTLLEDFMENTHGKLPEVILYYRDGVSEGQFAKVCDLEMKQIRQACTAQKSDYEPKITFIVVQKRHHTRFAPQNFARDGVGRPQNVPAGTTVDTDITHPSHFNFYLCSHVAIQGTSRPGHYNILHDDNDLDADTLQKLTFFLCHTYARCTKSISVPPPVMYADLAAFRAKLYITNLLDDRYETASHSSKSSDEGTLTEEILNAILLKENLRKKMYFI